MIEIKKAHIEFVEYLKDSGKSKSTVIAYEKDIEQLSEHLIKSGIEDVLEIEIQHLKDFMNKLKTLGLTAKTVSRKTNSTKTFFRYLMEKGHIESNVAEKLEHPKFNTNPPRILSRMEYGALRDSARNDARTFAMVETLIQTGIRISELAGMKLEHIELVGETGSLNIPARQSQHSRKVPLNKAAMDAINNYIQKERPKIQEAEHLFITKNGKPLLVRNIRATFDRHFKLSGIENAKVNDIRHTFVAHHLKQGTNLVTLSKIAGHKRLSTTEKYLEFIEVEATEKKTDLGIL